MNVIADKQIGLIAGTGELPSIFAEEAKKSNYHVVAFVFVTEEQQRKKISKKFVHLVEETYCLNLGEWAKIIDIFRQRKIKYAVMLGKIEHKHIFDKLQFDSRTRNIWKQLENKKANTLLKSAIKMLSSAGIRVLPSTTFLKHLLAPAGILSGVEPSEKEWEDINFGYRVAKSIAGMDIGQTVVVKDKSILAVEAMEGTDECILRAGKLCNRGIVVVKVARPEQDIRFDLPVVGLKTISALRKAKARILAIQTDKTLIIGKEKFLKEAEKTNLSVVGIK